MSHNAPEELKYTEDHEWIKQESDIAIVGITDFAQSSLGDIVFTELPEVGTVVKKGDAFGVVESIKSVSDLYSPINGIVTEKNSTLESQPELINQDPYENWLIKIKPNDESEFNNLLTAADYQKICSEN